MNLEEDVVHLKIHVMRVKVIAMDVVMVVSMMEIVDAKEILFVEAITVFNLASIITRKMTAVKSQNQVQASLKSLCAWHLSVGHDCGCHEN